GVEQAANGALRHGLGVEDVPRHQYPIDTFCRRQLGDGADSGEAGLRQGEGVIGGKAAVLAADLPIRGVQKTWHQWFSLSDTPVAGSSLLTARATCPSAPPPG